MPCTEDGANGSIKYDRYAFSRDGWKLTQTKSGEEIKVNEHGTEYSFTEIMPSIELNSIKKYGGFYIGRYEVGIEGCDEEVKTSNSNNETNWTGYSNGKAVVQANKQVWNYITRDMAKIVAEGMYENNNAVISRLCNSYVWDTVLQFIEIKNVGYSTNSEGDNYSGSLKHTGIGSIARNNIYDMGGNVAEWTTEVCSLQDYPCTKRGGGYGFDASDRPAGLRTNDDETLANDFIGLRLTLYVGM